MSEQIPERFTGGVDYTDLPEVEDFDQYSEHLADLSEATPENLMTLTGGHGDLFAVAQANMPADESGNDQPSREMHKGMQAVRDRYEGTPVRVVPSSRFRTMQLYLKAGDTALISGPDPRRQSCGINVHFPTDLAPDNDSAAVLAVGRDEADVLVNGFQIGYSNTENLGMPQSIVLNHGDKIAIGCISGLGDPEYVGVSIAIETLE